MIIEDEIWFIEDNIQNIFKFSKANKLTKTNYEQVNY